MTRTEAAGALPSRGRAVGASQEQRKSSRDCWSGVCRRLPVGPALDQAGAAQDGGAAGAALDEGCRIGENLESETAGQRVSEAVGSAQRGGACRSSP